MDNFYKALLAVIFFLIVASVVSTVLFYLELDKEEDIILESYTGNLIRLSIGSDGISGKSMYVSHNKKKWELKLKVGDVYVELGAGWKIDEENMNNSKTTTTTTIFGNLTFTLIGGINKDSFEYDYNIIGDTLVRKQETMVRMNTIQKYIDFKKKTKYYKGYIMLSWLPTILFLLCVSVYYIFKYIIFTGKKKPTKNLEEILFL